ncbi:MAG TPA: DUF4331 family protein [Blastocatellia bacterium]|nr:DUF4331 family protein [Blastocatellia bacterium]
MLFMSKHTRKIAFAALALTLVVGTLLLPAPPAGAADHGDSPNNANDRAADLGDTYAFLDPNDNTKVIIATTVQGFIVPGEAVNFSIFDQNVRFRFELETTGDAVPDHFIDVMFTEKGVSAATPQTAMISSSFFPSFTAQTTVANFNDAAPAPTITTSNGIQFFAGPADDPFFFDIPAFGRFIASVNAGSPNPAVFQRGRDTFAGYNTLAIAFSIPRSLVDPLLSGGAGGVIGVDARTQRRIPNTSAVSRPFRGVAPAANFVNVDRDGNPAVNVALIPFARKSEYNQATTVDDALGRFAPDIIATLTRLGTNSANISVLAGVAVTKGDYVHLNLSTANSGTGGGNNAGAGFPNGRRLGDDVIDTILTIIANGTPLGDNVNSNDVPFRDTFPFFAPPNQPYPPGTTDDKTRN